MVGGHHRDESESNIPLRRYSSEYYSATNDEATVNINLYPNGGTSVCHNSNIAAQNVNTSNYSHQIKRRRKEMLRTITAFSLLVLSSFLNFFILTVIHDIVPKEPLPDIVFMLIPQQKWAWVVGDVFSIIDSVLGLICILLHKHRLVIFRRVLLLLAIMYGLRAVVMSVTFLPPSFQHRYEICQPQVNHTTINAMSIATRFVTYVVTLGLTSGQEKILCGDLMFSGHTIIYTIMFFTQLYYTPKGLWIVRYLAAPISFLGIASLVVSGGHYTMDVLISYWLTSHVFWSYHQLFDSPRSSQTKVPMSRLWWYWVSYWFESDVPDGPMVNEWNWPFSSPKMIIDAVNYVNIRLQ